MLQLNVSLDELEVSSLDEPVAYEKYEREMSILGETLLRNQNGSGERYLF